MIDSNNIEIIRDNLKELDQRIDSLDVEIPAHTSSDAGKYLGVDSSGDLEFSYPLPAYSENETATGQKWIDGKDIYQKTFSGTFVSESGTQTFGTLLIDNLIHIYGEAETQTGAFHAFERGLDMSIKKSTGEMSANVSAGYTGGNYAFTIFYTKPDPEPSPETSTKKKKSTK